MLTITRPLLWWSLLETTKLQRGVSNSTKTTKLQRGDSCHGRMLLPCHGASLVEYSRVYPFLVFGSLSHLFNSLGRRWTKNLDFKTTCAQNLTISTYSSHLRLQICHGNVHSFGTGPEAANCRVGNRRKAC